MEDSNINLAISRRRLFLMASLSILSFSRSRCGFAPRSLMPFLNTGRVRSLGAPRTTLSLVRRCFRRRSSILLPDVLPRPFMPLRRHFIPGPLRSPPLRIAGTVRRVGRPTVAAYSFLTRPSRLVRVSNCPRHTPAGRRSLDRFLANIAWDRTTYSYKTLPWHCWVA
jgi:hypothetical protein